MGNKLGKSSENKKLKKRRCQSITWSFRYSTMRKKIPPDLQNTQINMPIEQWLKILDLSQYEDKFKTFSGMDKLIELNERDIKNLGIKNSGHRTRIITSLAGLHQKANYRNQNGGNVNPYGTMRISSKYRHSVAVTTATSNNDSDDKNSMTGKKTIDRSNSTKTIMLRNDGDDYDEKNPSTTIYETLNTSTGNTKQSKSCGDLLDMETTTTTSTAQDSQETVSLKKALEWELSLDSRDLRSHAWYHGAISRQRSEEIVQKDGDFLIRDCASQPGNYVLTCRTKTSVLHFVINKLLIQPETVYERVQYQFEDDAYDTVPDLITFYVGSGKPISAASGALIQYPCNRTHPLSFYGNKFGLHVSSMKGVSPLSSPSLANTGIRFNPYTQQQGNGTAAHRSPMSSPPRTKRELPPRSSKKHRSQSLTPVQATILAANNEKYSSADGVIQQKSATEKPQSLGRIGSAKCTTGDGVIQTNGVDAPMLRSSDEKSTSADGVIKENGTKIMSRSTGDQKESLRFSSLPRPPSGNLRLSTSRTSSLNRDISESSLSPCLEKGNSPDDTLKPPSPPPKPVRNSSNQQKKDAIKDLPLEQHPLNRIASYHASGSDSGNGSGDSAHSSAAGDPLIDMVVPHRGVIIKNPRYITSSASSMTLKSYTDFDAVAAENELFSLEIPEIEQTSAFDLENFNTLLLPSLENKPLDNTALNSFRMMLAEFGPRIIAQHMTRIDINLILGDLDKKSTQNKNENQVLECTGMELITLPHGHLFRSDLIERTQCLKLLVAVTILTCQSDLERAETLDKWIQIAVETKTALGNLFGFSSIMLGICMPQIQKLEPTWHTLRQKFTDSAFAFEAKLRPCLRNMNDCSNPQAPNTTVPHLLPYTLLRDRNIDEILHITIAPSTNSALTATSSLISTCITNWELNSDDFGLTTVYAHLDAARNFSKNLSTYKRNALNVLQDLNSRFDELLSDAFRTEFHIKFLWGSKGCLVPAVDRHAKLEQILAIMAEKFCNGCAG